MSYAIICDARKGYRLGISVIAMVDRSKDAEHFWTSNEPHLVMRFVHSKVAAKVAKRLEHNSPRVVDYKFAVDLIQRQDNSINEVLAENEQGHDDFLEQGDL